MPLLLNKNTALIFDMDGTMVNNMNYHYQAWRIFLNEYDIQLTDEKLREEIRGTNREVLSRIFNNDIPSDELDRMGDYKEELYRKIYKPHIKLIAGLDTLLDQANSAGISMAIATSANQANIDFVMNELNLGPFFKSAVSSEEVGKGKPHPDTFLKAAQELGFEPEKCIVFEDAPSGIEAARRAGMKAVALTTSRSREEFDSYENIIDIIDNYRSLNYEIA